MQKTRLRHQLIAYLDQEKYYVYVQDQHSFLDNKLQLTLGGRYDHHNIYGDVTNIRSGLYYQFAQGNDGRNPRHP